MRLAGEQRGDKAELVASRVREAISAGVYKPGDPIRQGAIAEELGISRIPVREGLHKLESEGLVVIRPNSTARVARLRFEECLEIYKTRERLEPLAMRESIELLSEEHLEKVVEIGAELEAVPHDLKQWLAGDRRLHLACYAGVERSRLIRTIVQYWENSQPYRRALLQTFSEEDFEIVNAEHLLIVDAVTARNGQRAEDLIRIHLERSRWRLSSHQELFAG